MESVKKKRKNPSSNPGIGDSEDRISSLADNLITHILSFLEIKQVIKTSLLATRWRSLWTTFPVLDFDSWTTARSNTATLINLFLLRYTGPKILKFRARIYDQVDAYYINSWIRFATTHGIEELDIGFSPMFVESSVYKKMLRFSNYGELRVLKLGYCALDLHASDRFTSLKELHLSEVEFTDLNTSGCPLLEKLIMKGCRNSCNIYAPNEKLRYLKDTIVYQKEGENELAVYAPHLLCIEFGLGFRRSYNLQNVSSVKSVIFGPFFISQYHNGAEVMVELMKNLSHAETLKLSMDSIVQLLTRANYLRMPSFSASSLEVEISLKDEYALSMIASLLNKTPCLETLIIRIHWKGLLHDYYIDINSWELLVHDLGGLQLRTVMIYDFLESNPYIFYVEPVSSLNLDKVMEDLEKTEMKLVEVLLKGCKALDKLVIRATKTTCQPSIYSKLLPALMGKLLVLPRASPNAGVHFFWNM